MSDEEIIKAIEERANKLGIKINLSYDFGSGRSDDAHMTPRGRAQQRAPFDAENRFCQFGKISFLLSLAVWIDESKTISALQVLKRHCFDQRRFFRAGLACTKSSNPGSMK